MNGKRPKYIEGLGWRYDKEYSKLHRMGEHDYRGRCIYMVTLTTEGRRPILGTLNSDSELPDEAYIEPTELGLQVLDCWKNIPTYYPEVKLLAFQLMPDHIHGLLFVTEVQMAHLGQMINGFKVGCNRAYRRLFGNHEAVPHGTRQEDHEAVPHGTRQGTQQGMQQREEDNHRPKHPEHGVLFAPGYNDSIIKNKEQFEQMFRYIADNPRRLAIKRKMPDLFRVVRNLVVPCLEAVPQETQKGNLEAVPQGTRQAMRFAAIGNRWLVDRPVRLQVRCHNNKTPENLRLIERQKAYFLQRGQKEGAVIVSPCISDGEREIARAALDAGVPLIVILENGFPPIYKPPGKYFEACCKGLLLMLAPWAYHAGRRTITRSQCLELNDMAFRLSSEPWSKELERRLGEGEP